MPWAAGLILGACQLTGSGPEEPTGAGVAPTEGTAAAQRGVEAASPPPASGVRAPHAHHTFPALSANEELGRARGAAQAFARVHGFPSDRSSGLAQAPASGPDIVTRDARQMTAYRWLVTARENAQAQRAPEPEPTSAAPEPDYVQAEVDDAGRFVVHGRFENQELGPWRPEELGLELVLELWPEEAISEPGPHLRIAARNTSQSIVAADTVFTTFVSGTLHVLYPDGTVSRTSLGFWRGPAPLALEPGETGSHSMNGLMPLLGTPPERNRVGRTMLRWESSGLTSNVLTLERDRNGVR